MAEAATSTDMLNTISYKDVKLYKDATQGFLGKGTFGEVYRCYIPEHGEAAIKLYELQGSDQDIKKLEDDILEEANLLRKIQRSQNVICTYGCTRYLWNIGIITEYMPRGDLNSLLNQKNHFIPLSIRLRILYDTATGLDHLHRVTFDNRITHNDLKPGNILLDENFHAKICDLGGANIASYTTATLKITEPNHSTVHTVPYAAPEFLAGNRMSEAQEAFKRTRSMDIYSFGMTSFFVLTSSHPFVNVDKGPMKTAIVKGIRPKLNIANVLKHVRQQDDKSHVIESLVAMVEQCWQQDPKKRPENAKKLKDELKRHLINADKDVEKLQHEYPIKEKPKCGLISLNAFVSLLPKIDGQYIPVSQKVREKAIVQANVSTASAIKVVRVDSDAANLQAGEEFQLKLPSRIIQCRVVEIYQSSNTKKDEVENSPEKRRKVFSHPEN